MNDHTIYKTNPPRPTLEETLWRVRAATPIGPRWSDWTIDVVKNMSPTIFTDTDLNVTVSRDSIGRLPAGYVRCDGFHHDYTIGRRLTARAIEFPWLPDDGYLRWLGRVKRHVCPFVREGGAS